MEIIIDTNPSLFDAKLGMKLFQNLIPFRDRVISMRDGPYDRLRGSSRNELIKSILDQSGYVPNVNEIYVLPYELFERYEGPSLPLEHGIRWMKEEHEARMDKKTLAHICERVLSEVFLQKMKLITIC